MHFLREKYSPACIDSMSENLTTSPEVALGQCTDVASGTPVLSTEGRRATDKEVLEAYEIDRVV